MDAPAARRHSPWWLGGLILLVAVPVVTAGAALAVKGWTPSGELAQAELRMRGFWDHPPDLGAVSRQRVGDDVSSHPGPAAWWLMYPVYALLGRSPGALSVSMAVVAAGWMAASVALMWRRAGLLASGLLTAGLLALSGALGPVVFTQPWNPWLGIFPFLVFLLCVWDVLCRHPWSLVGAVAAGSVAVQAHFGYAPVVGALGLVALAWAVVTAAPSELGTSDHDMDDQTFRVPEGSAGAGRVRRLLPVRGLLPVLASLGAGVVLWAGPVVQQLRNSPGNMWLLWTAYRNPEEGPVGLGTAVRVLGGYLSAVGPWLVDDGRDPDERGIGVGTVVLVAALVAVLVVAWRRRGVRPWGMVLALGTVVVAAAVVALVSVSRIDGEVWDYLVPWLSVLTVLAVVAIAWGALLRLDTVLVDRAPPAWQLRGGAARAVAAVALVALAVVTTVRLDDPPVPEQPLSETIDALARQVEPQLERDGRYLVRWEDPLYFGGVGLGLALRLERDGYQVGVLDTFRAEARPHRVLDEADADGVLWVVTGPSVATWRAGAPEAEIAAHDPRTDAERARVRRLRREMEAELSRIGAPELADRLDDAYWSVLLDPRVDDELQDRLLGLSEGGVESAVFLTAPGTPPPVPAAVGDDAADAGIPAAPG